MPGRKVWNPGDTLDAADINDFIMKQSVMVFADAAARDTALSGVLREGMHAYVGGGTVTFYDGSTWTELS